MVSFPITCPATTLSPSKVNNGAGADWFELFLWACGCGEPGHTAANDERIAALETYKNRLGAEPEAPNVFDSFLDMILQRDNVGSSCLAEIDDG